MDGSTGECIALKRQGEKQHSGRLPAGGQFPAWIVDLSTGHSTGSFIDRILCPLPVQSAEDTRTDVRSASVVVAAPWKSESGMP
jgi:hypothetical protein